MTKCPECGSANVERLTPHGLSCRDCGHDGRSEDFEAPQLIILSDPAAGGIPETDRARRRRAAIGPPHMIVVEYKSDVVGSGEFWRGAETDIAQIRNIPARRLAKAVAMDGKERTSGMWTVRRVA